MNYQRIYDQIIDRAQKESREKGQGAYYESHHIIPKCLGGSNKKENLALLTGREHFLCHWLLCRIYPENSKLVFAFWGMCNLRDENQKERHIPSSRVYKEAREIFSEKLSEDRRAFYQTEEGDIATAKRLSNTDWEARTANTDYKAFQEKRVHSTDYVARNAAYDWATKVANTDYKAIAKKLSIPIFQFYKDGTFIKEWTSIKEAGESLGIDRSNLSSCCRGRVPIAGGFVWKYK
jgi:hypothetical protein